MKKIIYQFSKLYLFPGQGSQSVGMLSFIKIDKDIQQLINLAN